MKIGSHPTTGTIPGVIICATSHQGLMVTVDGKPARLAIIGDDGQVIAAGNDVAVEAEAVAVKNYRNFLQGEGFLKTLSNPLQPA